MPESENVKGEITEFPFMVGHETGINVTFAEVIDEIRFIYSTKKQEMVIG